MERSEHLSGEANRREGGAAASMRGLDVTEQGGLAGSNGRGGPPGGRPFLSVFFKCANQYLRVYRVADGSGYRATCPKCGKRMNFVVGQGGTSQRFFEVSC